jgi:hypothetical protein
MSLLIRPVMAVTPVCLSTQMKRDTLLSRVGFPTGVTLFLLPRVEAGFGIRPQFSTIGARASFPGIKQPGTKTDNSPPSTAEVIRSRGVEPCLHAPIRLHGVITPWN